MSTHPIHDIPIELIVRIFRTGATTSLEEWKDQPISSPSAPPPLPLPMVVCAVCRSWRVIALNSPDLWSTIYVPILVSQARKLLYDAVKFTSTWLSRSKEATLDIFLRIPNIPLAYNLSVDMLLPKILQHSHRLRKILILGDTGFQFDNVRGIMTLISTRMTGQASHAHTIALRFQNRGPARLTDSSALLDRDWDYAPEEPPNFSASVVSLEGVRVCPSFFPYLESLTVAHLDITLDELRSVFESLPLLRRLHLPHLHVLLQPPEIISPIVVPSLSHISVSFHRRPFNSTSPYPIAHLRLPNLQTLALDGENAVPIGSCFGLPFVSSLEKLHTLALRNFVRFAVDAASDTTWNDIRILHSLPSIKRLELIRSPAGRLFYPSSKVSRPRKRSLGHRAAISPQLTAVSRTLEGMFQQLRVNSGDVPGAHSDATRPDALIASSDSNPHGTAGTLTWPLLEMICIDTMVADDIVNLCQYVSSNPRMKTIQLSSLASRHLSHSVKRRLSDGTFFSTNFLTKKGGSDISKENRNHSPDVEAAFDWMVRRLQIIPFEDVDHLYVD